MRVVGNRIPKDFFTVRGVGESDITVHAGSYHLALRDAGIEMANIMTYSSILPAVSREVPHPGRMEITHGEVMESIMAVATCEYGGTATAALGYGWLTNDRGRHGGLVVEYNGPLAKDQATEHVMAMLDELHSNGYEQYELSGVQVLTETVTPEKMYGTALVGLCFTNYLVPTEGDLP